MAFSGVTRVRFTAAPVGHAVGGARADQRWGGSQPVLASQRARLYPANPWPLLLPSHPHWCQAGRGPGGDRGTAASRHSAHPPRVGLPGGPPEGPSPGGRKGFTMAGALGERAPVYKAMSSWVGQAVGGARRGGKPLLAVRDQGCAASGQIQAWGPSKQLPAVPRPLPVSWHRWGPACPRTQGRRLQPLWEGPSVLPPWVLAASEGWGDAQEGWSAEDRHSSKIPPCHPPPPAPAPRPGLADGPCAGACPQPSPGLRPCPTFPPAPQPL